MVNDFVALCGRALDCAFLFFVDWNVGNALQPIQTERQTDRVLGVVDVLEDKQRVLELKHMFHQELQALNQMKNGKRPVSRLPLRPAGVSDGLIDENRGIFKERNGLLMHV